MTCSLGMLCTTMAALFVAEPSPSVDELDLTPRASLFYEGSSQTSLELDFAVLPSEGTAEVEILSRPSVVLEGRFEGDQRDTGRAVAHSGLFLGLQLGVLLIDPPELWPSGRLPDADQFHRSWTQPPTWDDGDGWVTNYVGHPLMGAYLYVFSRRTEHSVFASFAMSTAASLTWEYLIEAWWEQPSWSDLLVTSSIGALIGEGMWWVRQRIMADGRITAPEYVALALVDPITFLSEISGL